MKNESLIPHLFRTEYRKIVSVLCRRFGFQQMEIAEDIASETFLVAAQAWGVEGVPPNPVGWLYQVAKNKAKNQLHRNAIFNEKVAPDVGRVVSNDFENEIDLSPQHISDSQLQMMFAVCHPAISSEAQVGLSLRILCGFGIGEIADAFGTTKEVINKRLTRAKEKLREIHIKIEMPENAIIEERLDPVLLTIYLLFNEGYYSASQHKTLRRELCLEAMRLCMMLVENELTNRPKVNALLALMCFHASRFDARVDGSGELLLYEEQDCSLWNNDLIGKGMHFLNQAKAGSQLSRYHLEAGIAFWHTQKEDTPDKWERILQFYNRLLQIQYSPVAALNRTFALYKARGAEKAIAEVEKLNVDKNYFYYMLLGQFFEAADKVKSVSNYQQALKLARTNSEKRAARRKLDV
jgi:RNA polymerase sigma-70 factor (ECF subfamily)